MNINLFIYINFIKVFQEYKEKQIKTTKYKKEQEKRERKGRGNRKGKDKGKGRKVSYSSDKP